MKSHINWMVARVSQSGGEQEVLRELLVGFYLLNPTMTSFELPHCFMYRERDTAINDNADGFDRYGDHANS